MQASSTYEEDRIDTMDEETYFNKIYNETYSDILRFVIIKTSQADQVEDILQNTYKNFYLRILKKGFEDIDSPKAYITQMARRELSKHYKRKAIKREMETGLEHIIENFEADEVAFTEIVENKSTLEMVRDIADQLPLLSYKSFVLFYYNDMPIAMIAKNLEISENNVKNRLWRARNAVRKELLGSCYVK